VFKDTASHPQDFDSSKHHYENLKSYIMLFCCFRFESEAAATAALHRLHQLDILGHPLTVEYARGVSEDYSGLVQSPE
jgi:hypothetical protein